MRQLAQKWRSEVLMKIWSCLFKKKDSPQYIFLVLAKKALNFVARFNSTLRTLWNW